MKKIEAFRVIKDIREILNEWFNTEVGTLYPSKLIWDYIRDNIISQPQEYCSCETPTRDWICPKGVVATPSFFCKYCNKPIPPKNPDQKNDEIEIEEIENIYPLSTHKDKIVNDLMGKMFEVICKLNKLIKQTKKNTKEIRLLKSKGVSR